MANSSHTQLLHLAVETEATQTQPAYRAMLLCTMLRKALRVAHHAGYKILALRLVRLRRLEMQ